MKMVKVTAKIPEGLLIVIQDEAKRTGVGVQAIAGQLLTHGYNDIREKQIAAVEAKLEQDAKEASNVDSEA